MSAPASVTEVEVQARQRLIRLATTVAVASAVVLVGVKLWAYVTLNSVALLSTLADSATDLLASGLNFIAVRFALTPPDAQHRFGHGKAEPLSAMGQAAFIGGSAVLVGIEAASRFYAPAPLSDVSLGVAVTALSMVVTVGLVVFQKYVVRRTGSVAIGADALHYSSDLLLNGSVIAALVLSSTYGLAWADPVFATAISVFMLVSSGRIAREAVNSLMDHELPAAERRQILAVARRNPAVRQVHDLRTRTSGLQKFIQMHIVLDAKLALSEAHRISDAVEQAVETAFPGADIIIHVDPEGIEETRAVLDVVEDHSNSG